MMTGDKVNADEALTMGMLYKVYDDAEFTAGVAALSSKMAEMPTFGLALTKLALNKSTTADLNVQLTK